jgi:hypothetical protein
MRIESSKAHHPPINSSVKGVRWQGLPPRFAVPAPAPHDADATPFQGALPLRGTSPLGGRSIRQFYIGL